LFSQLLKILLGTLFKKIKSLFFRHSFSLLQNSFPRRFRQQADRLTTE
jgi:hypothetical protein